MIHHLLILHLNCLIFPKRKDRGTKMLTYIGNVTVNGFPGVKKIKNQYLMNRLSQMLNKVPLIRVQRIF